MSDRLSGENITQAMNDALKKASSMNLPKNPTRRRLYLQQLKDTVTRKDAFARLDALASSSSIRRESSVRSVWPKHYSPLNSIVNKDIPYYNDANLYEDDSESIKDTRMWCRYYYDTHHLIPTCIDIMARYPLVGMHYTCKDSGIQKFYESLFLEDLNYESFLIDLGIEQWKVGEAFPMCNFDDNLSIITHEELMLPDDIVVERNMLTRNDHYKFRISEGLKHSMGDLANSNFRDEHAAIISANQALFDAINQNNDYIDIDSSNIYHLKHGGSRWSPRGYPVMMRAFKHLLHEERLNRAQMAIAERLYTPLILLLLGQNSMGESGEPWIPTQGDISSTQTLFENLMESEYRTLVHHFGLDIKVPLSGERIPNLNNDYDRVDKAVLGVFGISQDLLQGGRSQSYASTAIAADFLSQRLNTYQSQMKHFMNTRHRRVAEAQGFYDYVKKGNKIFPIEEQVMVIDPYTGARTIEVRKKLLTPDCKFRTMDFRNDKENRDFLLELKRQGVLISNDRLVQGSDFTIDDERDKVISEVIDDAMNKARINRGIIEQATKENLLPYIDADYRVEEEPDGSTSLPGWEEDASSGDDSGDGTEGKSRPEQSDEQRGMMPKALRIFSKRDKKNATPTPPKEREPDLYESAIYGKNNGMKVISWKASGDPHPLDSNND